MTRQTILVAVATFVLGLGVSQFLDRPSVAQVGGDDSGKSRSAVGRYRVTATGTGSSAYAVLLDTETGECWSRDVRSGPQWHSLGMPPKAEKP